MMKIWLSCAIACLLSLIACDNSQDYFLMQNKNPQLTVLKHGLAVDNIEDSIKIGYPLSFDYKIEDEEIVNLSVLNDEKNIEVKINNSNFVVNGLFSGKYTVVIGCIDTFNAETVFNLNLTVFINLKPICKMIYHTLNDGIIEIDLQNSYDKDARFGGKITGYEYDFNGYTFTSNNPKVRHTFASQGIKIVKARVRDNNNEWSEWVVEYINVN